MRPPITFITFHAKLPLYLSRIVTPSYSSQRPRYSPAVFRTTATLPSPNPHDELEDRADVSWQIYSQPGNPCVICAGKGQVKCLFCFGDGTIRIGPEDARDTLDCPQCNRRGRETCIRCAGTGIRPSTRLDPVTGKTYRNPTNEEVRTAKKRRAVEEADAKPVAEDKERMEGVQQLS